MTGDLLTRVLRERPPAYALLHRPERAGRRSCSAKCPRWTRSRRSRWNRRPGPGPGTRCWRSCPTGRSASAGSAAPDDGAPLLTMTVAAQQRLPLAEALGRLPDRPVALAGERFEPDDARYAGLVRTVIDEEIGRGEGSNFVLERSFVADITGYGPHSALSFFRRLLSASPGRTGRIWCTPAAGRSSGPARSGTSAWRTAPP
ncbi:anthranilate synthase OS=Streptomyces fumanus OX=67302 GN=phzE1 PE=4 SV=1 [Streptomyces fumanus]